ncbi:hypothetical protein C0993_000490 [Termitomyces sp. T159_Od127]|nr:hypothetical protein C0993_000490 [Termitomyces sp. T159_Od127]
MQEALNPNQADNNLLWDPQDSPDFMDDEEALCASRFRNWPWIDVLEKTQEWRQREGACILCGEQVTPELPALLTAPPDNSGNSPPPQTILGAPLAFPPNIPCNKYKGPNYPTWCSWRTPDTNDMDQPPSPLNLEAHDIKIIGPAPLPTSFKTAPPPSESTSYQCPQKNT